MHADEASAPASGSGAADHELDAIGIDAPAAGPIQMHRREPDHHRANDLPTPSRGSGSHLPAETRAKMERSFGHDFSAVRVHVGSEPARIGADAYARGNDIHFAPGRFEPSSPDGERLLGHELAHVVQQRAGRVQAPGGTGAPINTDAALEAEADALGAKAAEGERAGIGGGGASAIGSSERAPIQRGRRKQRNRSVKDKDEKDKKDKDTKRKRRKSKKKEKEKKKKEDRKRKIDEVDNVKKFEPRKKQRTEDSSEEEKKKKKNVKKKTKKEISQESFSDGGDNDSDEDFVDERTMKQQLIKQSEDEYHEGKKSTKPTFAQRFDELKKARTMTLPPNPDFYHQYFTHEGTGSYLRSLSQKSMEQYNTRVTDEVTDDTLEEQSNYILKSLHTKDVKKPREYYDTPFDQQSLALGRAKENLKESDMEDSEKKQWRQPFLGARVQLTGSFVPNFYSESDYEGLTKMLQKSVNDEKITPKQIGTILNQPTPKQTRKELDKIDTLNNEKIVERDNYSKEEEMPPTKNDLYNLTYLVRGVEQDRNSSIGPFLGPLHTQVSNETVSLKDAFGEMGPYGMFTYTGSGTNTNSSKERTNQLIGLSMSQIEHQNLRDTNLGEKSVIMSGTNDDLKDRGMVARNLAKRHGLDQGMTLRANTPDPPSKEEVEKRYIQMLQRNYGSINNRDLTEEDFEKKKDKSSQKRGKRKSKK